MAYFSANEYSLLNKINGLVGIAQTARLAKIKESVMQASSPEEEKPAHAVHFGEFNNEKDVRLYELPAAEYATVQAVNAKLGALAACVVESYFAGEIAELRGLREDEQTIAREIASANGAKLP